VALPRKYVSRVLESFWPPLTCSALKIANERKSSVLASNAYHHRVDSLTAFVALLASWLDPVGGLVISLMVVQAGWANTKNSLFELADVGVEYEMKSNVRKAATKALDSLNAGSADANVTVRSVQGVKSGQNYLMDVELAVPGSWSVEQTRGVEELVRERVGAKVRGVKRVRVRFVSSSSEQPDFLDEFIGPDVSGKSTPESHDEHDHDHEHEHDHKTNGNAKKSK
jgi:divalent metal cation (Fe/Co/Zn/Cd) transporter